ncbi:MAG: hypothetical protein ACJ8C4_01685 [Gemmataceae bacterium]
MFNWLCAKPRKSPIARKQRFIPTLQRLEDRRVLSTITWKDPVSGNWNDSERWLGGVVPGASDIAVIDKTGANYSVTLDVDATVAGLTLNSPNATFSATNRTFTANGPATFTAGAVGLANSTWAGSGQLTNDARLDIAFASSISCPFMQLSKGVLR